MTAETVADALGGARRAGNGWTCRCPVPRHGRGRGDKIPSLSVSDNSDSILVHCHGGCPQEAVIAVLRERGLWPGSNNQPGPVAQLAQLAQGRNSKHAIALWRQAAPATGTPAERYIRSRGYTGPIPPTIRYISDARHPSGGQCPVMVAAVAKAPHQKIVALHRTFLRPDGSGKAPVEPAKASLGPVGGGAVRLAPATEHLAVTEGIETRFSITEATGTPTWAALSAGGIKTLILPPLPLARDVVIGADHDPVGLAAAYDSAERWTREGRRVRIALPPKGTDFNDLLLAKLEVAA